MLLRKANVVDGALRFIDAEGLDALTMRKLGATLNVQGGALYRHFPNKEALLDAMADKILEGVADALPEAPWHEQIFVLCERLRNAMLAHRDGARVVAGTYSPGVNTITGTDTAIQIFCRAGAAPAQAGWLTFALFYYVLGHTIEEQALAELPADDDWRSRNARRAVEASAEYTAALDSLTTSDPAKRFAYGLRTFLDGIALQLAPGQARSHQDAS